MTITKKQKLARERNWAKLRLVNCYATARHLQHSEVTTPAEKAWLKAVEYDLSQIMKYWNAGSEIMGMKLRPKKEESIDE